MSDHCELNQRRSWPRNIQIMASQYHDGLMLSVRVLFSKFTFGNYLVVKLSQVTKEVISFVCKLKGELTVLVAIIFLQITRLFDQLP